MKRFLYKLFVFSMLFGCTNGMENSQPLNSTLSGAKKTLFVASGTCYGGGVAMSTASNTVAAFDAETGAYRRTVVDYNVFSPGDTPVAIADYDKDRMLVLVENTSGRRLDLVRKDGAGVSSYLTNATALNGVLRAIKRASDGSLLVSKSTAIEKFSSSKVRIPAAASFVSAPAGACATTATLIPDVDMLSNGKVIYIHATASPNNKIVLIASGGYTVAGDCLGSQAAPTTTALPTGLIQHPSGKWLVSYGSTTAASNLIYSYDINETTNVFSNASSAFFDTSVVNGPSAIAVNPDTGTVFVANALSTFNTIEAFTLNGSTLSRLGTAPFAGPNIYTRCVSSMQVLDSP